MLCVVVPAQAQYIAEVREEHWAFQAGPGNEWEGELFADLFHNGILVPNNPSLSYKWYRAWPGQPFHKCANKLLTFV
jgi:hypothetical protein